jgi:hypothetical protein
MLYLVHGTNLWCVWMLLYCVPSKHETLPVDVIHGHFIILIYFMSPEFLYRREYHVLSVVYNIPWHCLKSGIYWYIMYNWNSIMYKLDPRRRQMMVKQGATSNKNDRLFKRTLLWRRIRFHLHPSAVIWAQTPLVCHCLRYTQTIYLGRRVSARNEFEGIKKITDEF